MFERLADGGRELHDEGHSLKLDTNLHGLELLCGSIKKRSESCCCLAVGDALEFGKYFYFILQVDREGNGTVCTVVGTCLLDAFAIMRSAASNVLLPPPKSHKRTCFS